MIQFNKVYIKDKNLYIDLQIEETSYYDNMTLKGLYITPYNYYEKDNESPESSFYIDFEDESTYINYLRDLDNTSDRHKVLVIPHGSITLESDMGISVDTNKLLIITATAQGTPAMNTPCGKDVPKDVTAVYNKENIFDMFKSLMKGLNCQCNDNQEFINLMMKLFALDFSIESGDIYQAIDIWERFFGPQTSKSSSSNCGCNG